MLGKEKQPGVPSSDCLLPNLGSHIASLPRVAKWEPRVMLSEKEVKAKFEGNIRFMRKLVEILDL